MKLYLAIFLSVSAIMVGGVLAMKQFPGRYQIIRIARIGDEYNQQNNFYGKDDPRSRSVIMLDSATGRTWELQMMPERGGDPKNPVTQPWWVYIAYYDTVEPTDGSRVPK